MTILALPRLTLARCTLAGTAVVFACTGTDGREETAGLTGGITTANTTDPGGTSGASGGGTSATTGASSATGGSSDSSPTTGNSSGGGSGPKFDVGTDKDFPGADDGGSGIGCQKIDFLFVVDNSGSMQEEQTALANSFPGFISEIQNTVMAQDYHIMVIDTDAGFTGGGGCTISNGGIADCNSWCADCLAKGCKCTCNNAMCVPPMTDDCDNALGGGKVKDKNGNACNISGGSRYMSDGQPNLSQTFSCAALVGTAGDGNEQQMQAMINAVTTYNAPGTCNEGFLRDDAILVVTFLTDEEDDPNDFGVDGDSNSPGNPTTWKQALVNAKHGDEKAVVVLGLIGDNGLPGAICNNNLAEASPRLRAFAESFTHGSWGSICSLDYTPFFHNAVTVVDSACDDFKPPG